MKKVLSIMLAAVMLCGLFAMPVSAKEYSTAGMYTYELGENTALNEDGYVVFDAVGDSFTTYIEVDENANYLGAINVVGVTAQHYIGTAIEIDGVRIANNGLESGYYPNTIDLAKRVSLCHVALTAGRHEVKIINLEGTYNVGGVYLTSGNYAPGTPSSLVRWSGTVHITEGQTKIKQLGKTGGSLVENYVETTIGVPEDGIYDLRWDIRKGYDSTTDLKIKATLDGVVLTGAVAGNGSASKSAFEEKVVKSGIALGKGTHEIKIESSDIYNFYFYVRGVKLVKTADITDYPSVTVFADGKSSATSVANSGAVTTAKHAYIGGIGSWIEYDITVPYDGIYTPSLGWVTKSASKDVYPRIYIDGACAWSGMILDESGATDIWYEYQTSELGDIALTAGNHKLRLYNGANLPLYIRCMYLNRKAANVAVKLETEAFDAEKSSGIAEAFGNGSKVAEFDDGSYGRYYVNVLENGFYNIACTFNKANGTADVVASSNGTKAALNIVGDGSANYRTENMNGMLYLEKGKNEILVRLDGIKTVIDSFTLTPASWATRMLSPKDGELYEGEVADANLAKNVKANTEYTAVADIGGAYVNKSVALIVAVYEGGTLKAAYAAEGTAQIGSTIEKTFTTPEAAGNYSVKVFVMDSLGSFKAYTEATEILPAVAE